MTYNFDPDRWFDNELAALESQRARGEIDQELFELEHEKLVDKYEQMLERLDIRFDYEEK